MPNALAESMLRSIAKGEVDDWLKDLNHAVVARWKVADQLKGLNINEGDTVMVTHDARSPKLRGKTGTVVKKDPKWISVEVTEYGVKRVVRFSPGILEVM
jgi:hypothetical protein